MAPRRIAKPYWLRATGAVVPWAVIARRQLAGAPAEQVFTRTAGPFGPGGGGLDQRAVDLQLRWQCNPVLGVPFGPFTVWTRRAHSKASKVDVVARQRSDGIVLRLPVVAATVVVDCQVLDATRAVGLIGTYRGGGLSEAVDAVATSGAGGGRVTLILHTSGVTRVLLVNGTDAHVQVTPLQDVIDDPGWIPVELVGLPVQDPWAGTAYDTSKQGLMSALTDPEDAALQRLARGGPPVGYASVTTSGHPVSPPWRAPEPHALLKEIAVDLLPRIERLYRPGLTPGDQAALADSPPVDPPTTGGRSSTLATKATLSPLSLLTLPSSADPFLALATGFGTAYPGGQFPQGEGLEFLVTADYPDTPGKTGPVSVAAYIPEPRQHGATVDPLHLLTRRAGLLAPLARDEPWRESVTVQWDRVQGSAGMGRPTSGVVARYEGGGNAEVLVEERVAGDRRPLVLVPDGPRPTAAFGRTSMVDADEVIPLGSGGRSVTYPVAVQDVFGVWSRWSEAPWVGTEPGPPGARVISVSLTSAFVGSTTCPATLALEVAVDWKDRTPTSLELHSVLFRLVNGSDPVPAGVDPVGPAPAGAFRRDVSLPFVGDTLTGPADVTVVHLDEAGDSIVTPGPLQGEHGRRYRLTVPVPTLDFSSTPRWGVQVWLRTPLAVVPDAGWLPDASHPALAQAANPVPIPPILPPPPPGVPLGSTPDAENRSHVRVSWSVAGGAPLDPQRGVTVWECAETSLRQAAGLAQRPPAGTLPGVRLAQLWDAYDALSPTARRAAFRRLQELPGTARDSDVALPAGSTDIHLFTVTTLSNTGVESPWPVASPAHLVLQAVAAPRLRAPGPPRVRSVIGTAGTVTFSLSADSAVPVASFALFRTRSAEAALRAETMGPAFAVVPAVAPSSGAPVDPASGLALYTGTWSGGFDPSWDDWHVRAVAIPVDTVPVQAVRGLPSPASDVATFRVRPDGPPDLAPLVPTIFGGAHDGVLVTTSTSAPVRLLPDGSFQLSGAISKAAPTGTAVDIAPVALTAVVVGPVELGGGPPAMPAVLVRSGPRTGGRTPLALWFARPVATDPVNVELRLLDPLGRLTVQTVTVPGWAPPPPSLELIDVTVIAGRRVIARVLSDAVIAAAHPVTMTIVATPRRRFIRPLRLGVDRGIQGLENPAPLGRLPLQTPVSLAVLLSDVPTRIRPSTAPVQVVRATVDPPYEYDIAIRLTPPFTLRVSLDTPAGEHAEVSRAVR